MTTEPTPFSGAIGERGALSPEERDEWRAAFLGLQFPSSNEATITRDGVEERWEIELHSPRLEAPSPGPAECERAGVTCTSRVLASVRAQRVARGEPGTLPMWLPPWQREVSGDPLEGEVCLGLLPWLTDEGVVVIAGRAVSPLLLLADLPVAWRVSTPKRRRRPPVDLEARVSLRCGTRLALELRGDHGVWMRLKGRRFPATLLLRALGIGAVEILEAVAPPHEVTLAKGDHGLLEQLRGGVVAEDVLNQETGEVLAERLWRLDDPRGLEELVRIGAQVCYFDLKDDPALPGLYDTLQSDGAPNFDAEPMQDTGHSLLGRAALARVRLLRALGRAEAPAAAAALEASLSRLVAEGIAGSPYDLALPLFEERPEPPSPALNLRGCDPRDLALLIARVAALREGPRDAAALREIPCVAAAEIAAAPADEG
jgi:hypothetical protein